MPDGGPFDQVIRDQLDVIRKDLSELRDSVRGRPEMGWLGLVARIDSAERQVAALKDVQDSFVRDRDAERKEASRKEAARNRIQVAVLAAFGAILSGVVVQLFVLIASAGP